LWCFGLSIKESHFMFLNSWRFVLYLIVFTSIVICFLVFIKVNILDSKRLLIEVKNKVDFKRVKKKIDNLELVFKFPTTINNTNDVAFIVDNYEKKPLNDFLDIRFFHFNHLVAYSMADNLIINYFEKNLNKNNQISDLLLKILYIFNRFNLLNRLISDNSISSDFFIKTIKEERIVNDINNGQIEKIFYFKFNQFYSVENKSLLLNYLKLSVSKNYTSNVTLILATILESKYLEDKEVQIYLYGEKVKIFILQNYGENILNKFYERCSKPLFDEKVK
jgi:hypothetical protein